MDTNTDIWQEKGIIKHNKNWNIFLDTDNSHFPIVTEVCANKLVVSFVQTKGNYNSNMTQGWIRGLDPCNLLD